MSLPRLRVLSDKDPAEIITLTFDFSRLMDRIDAVADVSVQSHKGEDDSPQAMLLLDPVIDGSRVLQLVQGGLDGVFYKVRAEVLVGHERYALSAILPVRVQ